MAEIVRCEIYLEAVLGELSVWNAQNPGVVDEYIHLIVGIRNDGSLHSQTTCGPSRPMKFDLVSEFPRGQFPHSSRCGQLGITSHL